MSAKNRKELNKNVITFTAKEPLRDRLDGAVQRRRDKTGVDTITRSEVVRALLRDALDAEESELGDG